MIRRALCRLATAGRAPAGPAVALPAICRPVPARLALAGLFAGLMAAPAAAQPVTGEAARAMLFAPDRVEVAVYPHPALDAQGRQILTQILRDQRYYAAVAMAPDEGIMSEALVAAANYHDVASARSAALEQCNARRSGGQGCVVVMELRPAGWEARPLQLNVDATRAFADSYMRSRGSRALATSASSGQWGIGTGGNASAAAVAACGAMGPARDCRVVIAD